MHRDAGKGENAILPRVVRGASDHDSIMALEVFGKDIGIEQNLGHALERRNRTGWTASLFVSRADNFVKQSRIIRAAE